MRPDRRLAIICIFAIFLVSAMLLIAKPQKSNDATILPSGRHLSSHTPGDPQKTNGLPTAIAIDLSGQYKAYADCVFPDLNYIVDEFFEYQPNQQWDLVFCSHTVEHLWDPWPCAL